MNKQEAIEKVKEHGTFYGAVFGGTVKMVPVGPIIDIIFQIDEPQKVVIPKFVAEYIERCKQSGWHLQKVLSRLDDDEKVGDWAYDENDDLIPEKVDMVAHAWLFGYQIEQEQLYTVEIPSITDGTNMLHHSDNDWYFDEDINNSISGDSRYHTKFDIEQAGFGWVFNCNGVKVVEVE